MGQFLDFSGVAGASAERVGSVIKQYARKHGGYVESLPGPVDELDTVTVVEAPYDKVTVAHRGHYLRWPEVSAHLSRVLKAPVFSFHIHDSDLWLYTLYVAGREVDAFNPLPDYWNDDISEVERRHWAGNAAIVCRHWPGVTPSQIDNYLTSWYPEGEEGGSDGCDERAAYGDDQHNIGDEWQRADFMRRLGLLCPLDEDGHVIAGDTYRFVISAE